MSVDFSFVESRQGLQRFFLVDGWCLRKKLGKGRGVWEHLSMRQITLEDADGGGRAVAGHEPSGGGKQWVKADEPTGPGRWTFCCRAFLIN